MRTFKTIGIGVAFSPNLKANIHEAVRLAYWFKGKLILIHVGEQSVEKEKKLESYIKPIVDDSIDYEIIFRSGHPVETILAISKECQMDLLLLGALQRENILKYYMGSIARKISRAAECSILLITRPSVDHTPFTHIVVNGLKDPRTEETLNTAFYAASKLKSDKITIVEEIAQSEVAVKVRDTRSLRKSTIVRQRIKMREDSRVKNLINNVPEALKENLQVNIQAIFGKRGYSIGHYAEVVRADLLVMNAPGKMGLWDRIFPHDIEHILTELPSDVLIIR